MIPSKVRAHISVRIVPDQDLESIAASVQEHLRAQFQQMRSPNKLNVSNGLLSFVVASNVDGGMRCR